MNEVTNMGQTEQNDILNELFDQQVIPKNLRTSDKKENSAETEQSFLLVRPINEYIEEASWKPDPKNLCDDFWQEGEISILFSDTGKGKTVMGLQIAECIATGESLGGFSNQSEPDRVFYLDYEQTDKQIEIRYRKPEGDKESYKFSEKLFRATLNVMSITDDFNPLSLIAEIEKKVIIDGFRYFVIDNITCLIDEIEKSKYALPLMRKLNALKKNHNLSILIIAHTPKRDQSRPITENSLQGSKMLGNLTDNMFAIGQSAKDANIRYIKRLKFRSGVSTDEIVLCEIAKRYDGMLYFEKMGTGRESEHLKESDKDKRDDEIISLHRQQKTVREIANEMGCSTGTVQNVINKHKGTTNE